MKTVRKQTIRFYAKHAWRYKWLTLLVLFATILATASSMVFPYLYKLLVDIVSTTPEARETVLKPLFTILILIVGFDLFNTISWRLLLYSASIFELRVMRNIINECFEYMHRHSFNFFNNNFVGGLVKKTNRITYAFEDIADRFIFDFIPIAIRVVIANAVLFYLSPYLGGALLIWTLFFLVSNYFLTLYKIKKYDLKAAAADTKVTARLSDTVMNNINIKLFGTRAYERRHFGRVIQNWFKHKKASWFFGIHIEGVQGIVAIILNFFILYFAITLWADGKLTVGDFVLIQGYLISLFEQLWHFGRNLQHLYERFADAEEMTRVLNTPWEVQDGASAKPIHIRHGKVEFKNVTFAYDDGTGVIKNLSLKINPSEKVAFVGPSGGGKSTMVKLLLRLFDVNRGEILIDGQNIAKCTQDSLRQQIALVPQDPILFHRTLIENIRYGRLDASNEEVIAAAKMARCHDFIQKFPKKYKTYVGERGVKLSGGERQRIAIARAILSNTPILILDEATSSLDSESEKLIQEALHNLMKQKTTFIIAHRLSTIVDADRILVLESGKIREEGTHSELIRKKGSLYEKLWGLQVGGYLE